MAPGLPGVAGGPQPWLTPREDEAGARASPWPPAAAGFASLEDPGAIPVPICRGLALLQGLARGWGGLVGAVGTPRTFSPPQEPFSTEPHCQGNSQCEIGLISN